MDANHWNRVDELLGAALDLAPEARGTFLSRQCGDDAVLLSEVERLLSAHEKAGRFIETSAMRVAARTVAGETIRVRSRSQIGPYRIISLLGAGGMGEVYLAEDTRLSRRIALKILPFPFIANNDRVKRFETEARAASALNHPNIITIYDIGQTADSIHYIAAEYVDGEILRTRLQEGAVAPLLAVKIAMQIAEALAAAHEAGISHRDIKPENIALRRDGYVKVLDFGLAKLTTTTGQDDPLTSTAQTQSGQVLGTVKYMSPEQALGQALDSRTDLWSLGCVFYEMLTGKPPFDGPSHAAVFDAILNLEPPALNDNAELPIEIDAILNRALEKDRELRYQTAADLRADLLLVQQALEPRPSKLSRAFVRLRSIRSRRFVSQIAALVLLASLALLAWFSFRRDQVPSPPHWPDWSRAKATQLTKGAGPEIFPVLEPDGKGFIYASHDAGNWDIYWQRVGGKAKDNLTKDSPADDTQPAYSPDGSYIAFRSERKPKGIYVMEGTSENVRRVSDIGYNPSWSPAGTELVVSMDAFTLPTTRSLIPSALWVIEVATGAKRLLTEGDAVQPSWSPNGHRIAYWGLQPGGGQRDIWTIPAKGGPAVAVTNDSAFDWNPTWSPDGRYLYFASDRGGSMNFWRVPIDEQSGAVKGPPETVTTPSVYSQHLSFSRDGRQLAYVQRSETQNLHRIAFDPASGKTSGTSEAIIQGTEYVTEPDISPNGEWIVYSSQGEKQEDIFLAKLDGSGRRQLTNDGANDRCPRWAPDGNRIAFYSDRSGRYEIWTINADGAGLRQLTFTTGNSIVYPIWSPDGNRLAYKQRGQLPFIIDANKPWDAQSPVQLAPPSEPKENFWPRTWSNDGRKLAGSISVASQNAIHTYDFETQTYQQLTTFGQDPVWLKDSRHLLFSWTGRIFLLDTETKKTQEVLAFPPYEIRSACLSRDERFIYYTLGRTEADIWLLSLDEPNK
jgi:Tol biopolymer transport system component